MKKSLLTIVLAFSFVLGGAALAPTVSEAHGYVASPEVVLSLVVLLVVT